MSHGRARRLPTTPCPYAMPKCRKDEGDTTSTATPRARTASTTSATKRPEGSSGPRGYDVVRTRTFIRRKYDRFVRLRLPTALPFVAGAVLLTVAGLTFVVRVPSAFHELSAARAAAVGRNDLGGALATADSVGMNDDFVRDAFADIPATATFAVVLPPNESAVETKDHVNPITFAAAVSYFEDFLLPRRFTEQAGRGDYIVCLYCRYAYWDRRTHWLSSNEGGGLVGLVYR